MSRDWLGYYQTLGLTPGADDSEIKSAFRQKAKKLHPDQNSGRDTTAEFQKLNQAHEILRDADKRKNYDDEGLRRLRSPRSSNTAHPAPTQKSSPASAPDHSMHGVPVHVCSACGCLSAQLRVVSFYKIYGQIIKTKRIRETAILCPRCALKRGGTINLQNGILGWWGLPFAPIRVLEASFINMRGGQIRHSETASLLAQQAQSFAQAGQTKLAAGLFQDAFYFAPDRLWRDNIMALRQTTIGEHPIVRMKNQWRFFGQPFYMVQLFLSSAVTLWLIFVIGSFFHWFGLLQAIENIGHWPILMRISP